jgi:CheY-like chemotaxis protein
VIRDQAQNASRLIRQILDFSRQTVIERQQVDLVQLTEESLALWQRTLPESIHFTCERLDASGGPLASALIFAEASSIQQALTNLAVNARDAMPAGGDVRLAMRAINVGEFDVPPVTGLKPGAWFQITVSDSGEGILPEHLPHIFDPFFTTKEIGKGTGLGLAQVYGIVQQHGGMVTARSVPGQGTSISLFLPALQTDARIRAESDAPETSGAGDETILLVEDNEPAREATSALLVMLGYRVIAAKNGKEALAIFEVHAPTIHLVLSDAIMPVMGGLELYKHVTAIKPAVSVLMMTGYPLEQEQQLAATAGGVEWLRKPFSVKQLTAAVRRVLGRAANADGAAT